MSKSAHNCQSIPNIDRIKGVSNAVKRPLSVNPSDENAP